MWNHNNRKKSKVRQFKGLITGEPIPRRILWLMILFVALLMGSWSPLAVNAQVRDSLVVLPPDTDAFPILSVQVKPRHVPSGEDFELTTGNLTVQENGRVVPIVGLDQQRSGVHFTLAINGDRRFDLRDANGVSPYDRIREALIDWAGSRRFASGDTLSLFTQDFAAIRNTALRDAWIEALDNYQPNFRTMTPNLASLEAALRAADERVVPFGVDKAILYITPPPNREEINQVVALTESARSAGIQVNVWMLGEEFFLSNDQGRSLIDMAAVTGGQFFHYTGMEPLPAPETYLENLGIFYTLQYESRIREQGTYSVEVIADLPNEELRGESADFMINVQPPKPIFLSPPAEILREAPAGWEGELETLTPTRFEVEFIIEFPDQYPRDLVRSWLYVDGRLVDTRDEGPFSRSTTHEVLTWDLAEIIEPGEHLLQIKIEDVLGLQGETIITPIQIGVQLPEPEESLSIQQIGMIVVGGILVVAVALLLIWSARRFLQGAFAQRVFKKVFDSTRRHIPTASLEQGESLYATLLPLKVQGLASEDLYAESSAIFITKRQTAFGCDPEQADQVLGGEDVAGLHARLRVRKGKCWLSDSGSAGGTWVNYERIGRDPLPLHPGDLIHFGDVAFRFTVVDPALPPRAAVIKYEPLL